MTREEINRKILGKLGWHHAKEYVKIKNHGEN